MPCERYWVMVPEAHNDNLNDARCENNAGEEPHWCSESRLVLGRAPTPRVRHVASQERQDQGFGQANMVDVPEAGRQGVTEGYEASNHEEHMLRTDRGEPRHCGNRYLENDRYALSPEQRLQ